MSTENLAPEQLSAPRVQSALRTMKLLVGAYAGLSVLTLVAIVLLRNDPTLVNTSAWIRGIILAAVSLLTYLFTARAAQGAKRMMLRVRIVTAVQIVAIVVLLAIPGTPFPTWMKIEQVICGLVLIGVALVTTGKPLRTAYAS